MKHNFLKKLMALLLSTFMVLSLVPAITFTANAADKTVTVSIADYADENGWANDKSYDKLIMDENITVTTSGGGNTGKYYTNGSNWRFYQTDSSKFTISASNGATIVSVKVTYSKSNTGVLTYNGSNKTSNTVITVNATSATFGVGNTGNATNGQVRITAIEVVYSKSACEHLNKGPAGVEQKPTCDEPGLTAGVKCLDCGVTITAQETISAKGHTLVNGVCSVCGTKLSGYVLVTDASTLQVGDKIIIVAKDYNYALSTTQNGNNRGQVEITKNDENTVSFVEGVQIITLEAGTGSETFAFNTGSGYLYAASSSANHLKTQTKNDLNSSWSITIANGVASIIAQGENTRNVLQYNQSSSLFACYASASQKAVSIYKLVGAAELKTLGLTLNKGITVKVKLDISAEWFAANPDAKVEFSNGTECVVTGAGEHIFTTELTPAQFDDALTVTYGDLNEVVSVAKYKALVEEKNGTNTKLINLLDAIIKYGEVASGAATIEGNLDSVEDLDVEKKDQNLEIGINATLSESATINLSFSGADVNKFVITKNDAPFAEGEITDGKLVLDKVFPNTYDDKFTLTVYNGTTEVATVKFTVNAYFKELAKQYPSCANIVVAAYQYGLATEAYLAK